MKTWWTWLVPAGLGWGAAALGCATPPEPIQQPVQQPVPQVAPLRPIAATGPVDLEDGSEGPDAGYDSPTARPPAHAEGVPPSPGEGMKWKPGYWRWLGHRWGWRPGRYVRERCGLCSDVDFSDDTVTGDLVPMRPGDGGR